MAERKAKYILEAEDRTKLALKNAERNFERLGKSVVRSLGPMLGLAAGAGMTSFINSTLDAADALAKTADQLGLTTDMLQELNFAAERSGISTEQLANNMTAFVKRVGEARQNTGPLVAFLKKYDEELLKNIQHSKDQGEALQLIAEAIGNAATATDRAAIANAAFSRSGIGMVTMLQDGKKGLEDFQQGARDAGAVLDERLLRSAEDINDQFDTMVTTVSTKLKWAVLELADAVAGISIDSLFKKQVELSREIRAIQDSSLNKNPFSGELFPFFENQVKSLKEELEEVNQQIDVMQAKRNRKNVVLPAYTPPVTGKGDKPDKPKPTRVGVPKVDPYYAAIEGLHQQIGLLGTTTQYEKTLWEVQNGRYKSLTENQKGALLGAASELDAKKIALDAEKEAKLASDQYVESQEAAAQQWRDLLNPMEEVDVQIEQLDRLLAEGRISWDTYAEGVFHTTESLDDLPAKTEEVASDLSVFADEAARNMQNAFAEFLFKPWEDGLDGMLRDFVDTMHRMASNQLAKSIFENLFPTGGSGAVSGFGSLLAGLFHDGGIVGQGGSKKAVNPLVFAGAPRYHSGGIAGLAPDEVPAILQRGERVIPRDQVGAGAGEISIRSVLVDDQRNFSDFMASSAGEKVILQHIRRNSATIRSVMR